MNPDVQRVMFAGDWHGNSGWAVRCIAVAVEHQVDAIVQLGDFGIWPGAGGQLYLDRLEQALASAELMLYFIDGNHEDFPQLLGYPMDVTDGTRLVREHIRHLPRGYRWTWSGVQFLALGGATSLDRSLRREGTEWWPQEATTSTEAQYAMAGGHADVMLTHDAPHDAAIPGLSPNWPAAALVAAAEHRRQLSVVVDAVAPQLLLHGHFHTPHTMTRANGTKVIGLDADGVDTNVMLADLADWRRA